MDFFCVGFHILLGFGHVYILFTCTLQKVCPICCIYTYNSHETAMFGNCITLQKWFDFCILLSHIWEIACGKSSHLVQRQFRRPPCSHFLFRYCRLFSCCIMSLIVSPQALFLHSFSLSNNIIHAPHRNAYDWMYTMPAVLPHGFHVSIIISLCLNITWLFLYDRE